MLLRLKMKNIKNIFIEGDKIYLRPLEIDDIDGNYKAWLNDPEIVKLNSHGRYPVSISMLKEYVNRVKYSESAIVLAIIHKKANKHIENISLQSINLIDRNAEIAFLLGEKSFWYSGIMFEAGSLLIDHGFNKLNLHRIHCGTSSENHAMQKLALKLGMSKEGEKEDFIFKNGRYLTTFEYRILRNEY